VATVILVGSDAALLEGLAQSLVSFDHDVIFAGSIPEIPLESSSPLLLVISAEVLEETGAGTTIPLPFGSSMIVYGASHNDRPFLSPRLQRATLAYLVLPLERHRLVALAHSFDSRSRNGLPAAREEWDDESEFRL
jgi:hypothetical protein